MGSQPDLYAVLSVPRTATAEEIHQAFRQRARTVHPDVNPSPDATREFQELNSAYQTLSDPTRRAAYDRISGGYVPPTRQADPGYWTPPPRTRTAYRTSTPPYDEPFAPRPRRRNYARQLFDFNPIKSLRWIWAPFLLLRLCTLSTSGFSSWWTADNLIAFINNWLPIIVIGMIVVLVAIGLYATVRWWSR